MSGLRVQRQGLLKVKEEGLGVQGRLRFWVWDAGFRVYVFVLVSPRFRVSG